jgi:hypothetical protein
MDEAENSTTFFAPSILPLPLSLAARLRPWLVPETLAMCREEAVTISPTRVVANRCRSSMYLPYLPYSTFGFSQGTSWGEASQNGYIPRTLFVFFGDGQPPCLTAPTLIPPYRGVFEYSRTETKIIGIHKMERALLLVSAQVTLSLFFRAGRFSQSVQMNSIDPFPRPPPITPLSS